MHAYLFAHSTYYNVVSMLYCTAVHMIHVSSWLLLSACDTMTSLFCLTFDVFFVASFSNGTL